MLFLEIYVTFFLVKLVTSSEIIACDEGDCMHGTICVGLQCVVMPCEVDADCPRNFIVVPCTIHIDCFRNYTCEGIFPGYKRCVHGLDKPQALVENMLAEENSRGCSSHSDCKKDEICYIPDWSEANKGMCRTNYGQCESHVDCKNSRTGCYKVKGESRGFCLCNFINEVKGGCGPRCSKSSDCPLDCQACYGNMCSLTPALRSCQPESEKSCQSSPPNICSIGRLNECCTDCDCISNCKGSFCSAGLCKGSTPWFCPNTKTGGEGTMCRKDQQCSSSECCIHQYGICSNQDLTCRDACKDQSRQKMNIVYHENNQCSCYCNGEEIPPKNIDCPAGFNTVSNVEFDAQGNCKCDCKLQQN